jgi:hypothetical protein
MLIVAAELDVLCKPSVLLDAAKQYRASFNYCLRVGMLSGVDENDARVENDESGDLDGVAFQIVRGLGHHLQNHVEWEGGAQVMLRWMESL